MEFDNRPAALSVVIVSWNTRELLDGCLHSVVHNTKIDRISTEIIVVDNASADGTVENLGAKYPTVNFVPLQSNIGFASAMNVGIRQASGRYVLLLNPDTEVRPGSLPVLIKTLDTMPHVGMVSGLLLNPDGSLQSSGYRFPGLIQSFLDFFPLHPRLVNTALNGRVLPGDRTAPYEVDYPLGACMLVRREVICRVGPLDERYFMYSEEIDWCQRIRAAGWSILIAPEARIVHYGGQSTGQMPEEMFLQLHRSRAWYFQRYKSPAFLRSVELMAQWAGIWARVWPRSNQISPTERNTRVQALRSVARIYAQARVRNG